MRYQGSEARDLERGQNVRQESRPSFSVVEGGGLDARARRGVSEVFLARLRAIVIVAAVLVALGCCRVAIAAATSSCLSSSMGLRSQIEEAQATNDELQIQRSQLSSSARIDRIATQNYGMVRATTTDTITLDGSSQNGTADGRDASSSASAEAAQTTLAASQDASGA